MTRHRADLSPSGLAPAEVLIPVYLHVQSRRAGQIKGEAKAAGHVDEIEVTSWQWGAQANAAMHSTVSMGRSQCAYRALTICKRLDTATTALMWALARNDELREVRLTMRRPASSDGAQEDVFTITLSDARVVALDHEAAAEGSTREVVTIESKVVQTQYQSGKPRRLVIAHRLPAPQPAQKAIGPALGAGAPDGRVARDAGIEPVWSFREASMVQRKLDDAKALAEHQARLASQPMQYVGPMDDAGKARAALAQQRTANNLAAAVGGPFVAAPMLTARAAGLDEYQVEQAGMFGLSAMDAAGVKSGGMATRLASGSRRAGVPITPQPLDPYFAGDHWTPVRAWRLVEDGGRYFTVGSSGSKFSAMGEYNFVTIRGETYVAKQQVGGHYDISMGAGSVDYAGIARFGRQGGSRGFIKEWSNNSGHYKPNPDDAIQAGLPLEMFKPHR